jgi:prephenate dehydrogenase
MHAEQSTISEHSIVIIGVGLIGGSIAAAVRRRLPDCQVVGIGRNPDRLRRAAETGLLSQWSTEISPCSVPGSSLAIVCLPVDQIADAVSQLVDAGCELVTDAGSVKTCIYDALGDRGRGRYVGSHPIAGSEQYGFEHADADLFVNRLCVVTPGTAAAVDIDRVVRFWEAIGSSVHQMSPDEHDRVLALTSHLPHFLASVAAGCVDTSLLPFTGSGFRDTTRIAAGSPSLWTSILIGNAWHCVESIRQAESLLQKYREALTARDSAAIEAMLTLASHRRNQLKQK